ncbi:MAG: hypothetical protein FJ313_05395, partial [Gemmatimonadetes bacterium]|nr:hypothetical protein [Gemmatimonadota bacterium]
PALVILGLTLAAASVAAACAESGAAEPSPTPQPTAASASVIQQPDRLFTLDDLIAAGWKKSKQLDAGFVPAAVEVWYGFYSRKDIEVRVYASHQDVLQHGVGPAEEVARSSYRSDFFKGSAPNYSSYMILGNLILLCQFDVDDCEALTANVK